VSDVSPAETIERIDIAHIVRHLRARDRAEIFGLRWSDDEDQLVNDIAGVAGMMWRVWRYQGEPVAMNGIVPLRPGVVSAGAFGTDKWRHVVRAMTRWSREFVIPSLQLANYHRGEAMTLASNVDSRRWIESLGGQVEAYLHHYGRNREDYVLYAWRLDEDVFWRRRRRGRGRHTVCQCG